MGLHEDSATDRDKAPHHATPVVPRLTPAVERRRAAGRGPAAPYAARTRDYYRSLSASSVGLEFAIAVVLGLFVGMWLDKRFGTGPWLLIVSLGFGFTAAMRGVWRHVAASDRAARESER
jgi:ATP synthase protein I